MLHVALVALVFIIITILLLWMSYSSNNQYFYSGRAIDYINTFLTITIVIFIVPLLNRRSTKMNKRKENILEILEQELTTLTRSRDVIINYVEKRLNGQITDIPYSVLLSYIKILSRSISRIEHTVKLYHNKYPCLDKMKNTYIEISDWFSGKSWKTDPNKIAISPQQYHALVRAFDDLFYQIKKLKLKISSI